MGIEEVLAKVTIDESVGSRKTRLPHELVQRGAKAGIGLSCDAENRLRENDVIAYAF